MKKIISLSIFAAAFVLAASCAKEVAGDGPQTEPQPEVEVETREISLTAGAMAKTTLADDGKSIKWKHGDKIAVVFSHSQNASHVAELATEIEGEGTADKAKFKGELPVNITAENGYSATFAVHPSTAVDQNGAPSYNLPVEQVAEANGAFADGLNLSSTSVAFSDINAGENASVSFHNALSILKFKLSSDVTSVTFEGSTAFAGQVPLLVDESQDGRLVVDTKNLGTAGSKSVTLLPPTGSDSFTDDVVYNLLVWPGTHSQLVIKLGFKNINYQKTVVKTLAFAASMFYTLGFNADEEVVLQEISDLSDAADAVVGDLTDLVTRVEAAENTVSELMSQIQSVAVMSEYAENVAMAPYSVFGSNKQKNEISLNYMIRPADVAAELVSKYADAMSMQVCYRSESGSLSFGTLPLNSAEIDGDILSVKVNAGGLRDSFYNGNEEAQLALQISDGKTEILSDFVTLVPALGGGISIKRTDDIPALKGATLSFPFSYAPSSDTYSLTLSSEGIGASDAWLTYNNDFKTGYIYVSVKENVNVEDIRVTVKLTSGDEVIEQPLTFADGGRFNVKVSSEVDYIGGEVTVTVEDNDFGSYSMQLKTGGWIYQTNSGVNGKYTVDENTGGERNASLEFSISTDDIANNGSLKYAKSVSIVQKAYGTPLTGNYFAEGEKFTLQTATAAVANKLNIVILGDGYRQKDLLKGGKFESRARSAMDAFFGVAPVKDFRDRFNVYMVAYKSDTEGPGNTYFGLNYSSGSTGVNYDEDHKPLIENAVKQCVDNDMSRLFRTIVIILANTDASIGSTNYLYQTTASELGVDTGDGFASVGVSMLTANSTATNGLIRHEAVGHAFGRLGDEYEVDWYTTALVNERHNVGFYRNVATDKSYWSSFTNAGYGSDEVMYDEYMSGLYRSTNAYGMMYNNTGKFNAVCRWLIYDRIRKQTEGNRDYWDDFLTYDQQNR